MGPGSDTSRVQMVKKSRVFFFFVLFFLSAPAASCVPDFNVRGPYGSSADTAQSRITGLILPLEGAEVQRTRVQKPTCGTEGALQDRVGMGWELRG